MSRIWIYLLVHLVLSLTYMTAFIYEFSLPWFTLVLHIHVIVLIHMICILTFSWLLFFSRPMSWFLSSVVLAFYWAGVISIYAFNWISNTNWGSNVRMDLIIKIPEQIDIIMNINDWNLWMVILVALFGISLCFWLARLLLKPLFVYQQSKHSIFNKFKLYALILIIFSLAYISITFSPQKPMHWKHEPIMSVITEKYTVFDSPRSKFEAMNDQVIRLETQQDYKVLETNKNVILIIVDSLRADMMSAYGFKDDTSPFLNKMVQDKLLQKVDYFLSTCPESTCSIYSIFSSRNASRLGMGLYDLADVLKDVGYENNYIISARHDYNGLSDFYNKSTDSYITGYDFHNPYELYNDGGVIDGLKNMDDFQGQHNFIYLHLMSAHYLGKNKEHFNKYLPEEEFFLRSESNDDLATSRIKATNAYKNGLLQADDYIKQVFDVLKDKNYLQESIVVIVGDHGEGLGERGHFSHTYYNYHEDLNVPFLIYDSSSNCQLNNTSYGTHLDVAPTILDCLNIPIPESWQGMSLLQDYKPNRISFHESIREEREVMVALENRRHLYKLMATQVRSEFTNFRLYDYYADPEERFNLIENAEPEVLSSLMKELHDEFGK